MKGIDLVSAITPDKIPALKAAGISVVIRYLSDHSKGITKPEYDLLLSNGLGIILVFESQGDQYSYFTSTQGAADAGTITRLLGNLNAPERTSVYVCACDFDASDTQIKAGIHDYFTALSPRLSNNRIGAYGNGAALAHLLDAKLISMAWVWGASHTNGTQDFLASGRWMIRQYPTISEFGLSVDPDDIQGDGGAIWGVAGPASPVGAAPVTEAPPSEPALRLTIYGRDVARMQTMLGITADGICGPETLAALTAALT